MDEWTKVFLGDWNFPYLAYTPENLPPNFEKGVLYIGSLNRNQPAAWIMLGILAHSQKHMNLAVAAYRKAIALGSPQRTFLEPCANSLQWYIEKAQEDDKLERRRRPHH